jgi:hypothetical protein
MGYLTGLREGIGSLATATAVLATAAALAACSAEATPTQAPAQAGEQAGGLLLVSDLAVGENRLAFTILSPSGDLLDDARVHVRFFLLHPDGRDEYRSEADAVFRPVSELQPHLHADGSEHHHGVKGGIYTVDRATFDEAGVWEARFDMAGVAPDAPSTGTLAFQVKERTAAPALGDPVPSSLNPTARDVADLTAITTHDPPVPALYELTVAEALERPRPLVVAFSTPAFCVTEMCGPVTDIVAAVYERYGDQADFIHIEPWDLAAARTEGRLVLTDSAREWGLPTEPWVFVVSGEGRVAARFEGLVTEEEIVAAVEAASAGATRLRESGEV